MQRQVKRTAAARAHTPGCWERSVTPDLGDTGRESPPPRRRVMRQEPALLQHRPDRRRQQHQEGRTPEPHAHQARPSTRAGEQKQPREDPTAPGLSGPGPDPQPPGRGRPGSARCVGARESGAGDSGRRWVLGAGRRGGATGAAAAGRPDTYRPAVALRLLRPGVCSGRNRRPRGKRQQRGGGDPGGLRGPARRLGSYWPLPAQAAPRPRPRQLGAAGCGPAGPRASSGGVGAPR